MLILVLMPTQMLLCACLRLAKTVNIGRFVSRRAQAQQVQGEETRSTRYATTSCCEWSQMGDKVASLGVHHNSMWQLRTSRFQDMLAAAPFCVRVCTLRRLVTAEGWVG